MMEEIWGDVDAEGAQAVLERGCGGCACCSHVPAEDIAKAAAGVAVVAWYYGWYYGGYSPEHELAVLGRLEDGTWFVLLEGEDTSGHGCQCFGSIEFFDDLLTAVRLGVLAEHVHGDRELFLDKVIGVLGGRG